MFLKPAFGPTANSDPPSVEEVRVACALVANQATLASGIAASPWDEFHGRGPTSGFWWDGDISEIQEVAEQIGLPTLEAAGDVRALLKLSEIAIGQLEDGSDEVVAVIAFRSAFEEEHGIGVLTDGLAVLGTGYMSDGSVARYRRRKKKSIASKQLAGWG